MKKLSSIFFALVFLFIVAASAHAAPPQIFITQVQTTGGAGKTTQDFIELFNPGDSQADLKGFRLVKRTAGATSDTLIKSWDADAYIPPKSFYLWANSSYTSIAVKPDVVTSATISDDNGIALRFGSNDTGLIIDSVAWGSAGGAFNNVTKTNPYAGQAIFRQNWYTPTSAYFIASPKPHNSQTSDMTAAFAASQGKPTPSGGQSSPKQTGSVNPSVIPTQDVGQAIPTQTQQPGANYQNYTKPNSAKNYLILAGAAFLALLFLGYKFFWKKN